MKTEPILLIVEDDPDDVLLLSDALLEANSPYHPHFISDGDTLMTHLHHASPRPQLILLDLNLPGKDGRQLLTDIKTNPQLCHIPVIIFTTSQADEDVQRSYQHGANAYMVKPHSFTSLVQLVTLLERYWLNIVILPSH